MGQADRGTLLKIFCIFVFFFLVFQLFSNNRHWEWDHRRRLRNSYVFAVKKSRMEASRVEDRLSGRYERKRVKIKLTFLSEKPCVFRRRKIIIILSAGYLLIQSVINTKDGRRTILESGGWNEMRFNTDHLTQNSQPLPCEGNAGGGGGRERIF